MYDSFDKDWEEIQAMRAELGRLREQIQQGYEMLDTLESMYAIKANWLEGVFLQGVYRERKPHTSYSKRKMRSMFL